jgi:hypothetical protein
MYLLKLYKSFEQYLCSLKIDVHIRERSGSDLELFKSSTPGLAVASKLLSFVGLWWSLGQHQAEACRCLAPQRTPGLRVSNNIFIINKYKKIVFNSVAYSLHVGVNPKNPNTRDQ